MVDKKLREHICSDKMKWFASVIAFILLAVFLAAACTQGFKNGNPWGWFDKEETQTEELSDESTALIEDTISDSNI